MIIHNLNIFSPCIRPTETETELIIYPNAVLPCTIVLQSFQPIPRRHSQITQSCRNLQLPQLAPRYSRNVAEPPDLLSL
jgi:hypothetical protein